MNFSLHNGVISHTEGIEKKKKMTNLNFHQWLEMKYLEWQRNEGGRKTVLQFARYLDVSQQTLSTWMNETRTPQGDNIRKIADKLGIEVYDVLGLPRPNPMLFFIQKHWNELDLEDQQYITKKAKEFKEKNERKTKTAKHTKHADL